MRWLVLVVALVSCHRAPHVGARSIVDGLGRTVTLGAVHRVVSLAPSSTEIVYALGAGDLLVGVDRFSDYPPAATKLPSLGTEMQPSLEKLVALHPDVVLLATSANAQGSLASMTGANLAVYVSRADSLEQIFADIHSIGEVLERDAAADALVSKMRARIAALPHHEPVPCAIIVWPQPLVVAGPGSHVDDLLRAAGCKNVVDDTPQPYPTYSTERLVKRAPAVLFVGTHSAESPTMDSILALSSVPAVRDHRVKAIDGDLVFRPGPRVVDGIEHLEVLLR